MCYAMVLVRVRYKGGGEEEGDPYRPLLSTLMAMPLRGGTL